MLRINTSQVTFEILLKCRLFFPDDLPNFATGLGLVDGPRSIVCHPKPVTGNQKKQPQQ
jgi:hypothetical protein